MGVPRSVATSCPSHAHEFDLERSCAQMGQGLHTKVCQVAARAFAVPLSACHVVETSTDKVANSQPTAASASTDLYAMATLDACRQILSRLRPLRERMPKATLAELALAAFFERIDLSAHGEF